MGRREQPLDPAEGPVAAFAVALRKLRVEAGSPTYRAMAERVSCSAATLAQAASGTKLPTLAVTLAYAQACGAESEVWRARWQQALEASREPAAGGASAAAPYRGLARFEVADQAVFFGRTALIEHLAAVVEAHRVVLVVGPSGCGKSSVLRAGLVPALAPRAVEVVTPGAHPSLDPVRGRQVVVVDQFEETFTLCQDPAERQAFIDALLALGGDDAGTRVVLAVRADFFGWCAHHPELAETVRDATVLVGAMTAAELREAITKPAAAVGLIVQRRLTARILEEITGQPGGLPLMSHALLETWRRHSGKALTTEAYEAAGGIDGAVARTAEQLYAELTDAQRQRLRSLLLRLVTPGQDGAADTRRPVARSELLTGQPDDCSAEVLERLAAARLITLDDDTADLAHETLLTAWPRLRSWVSQDRERLRVHRRLTEAAHAWHDHARDPGSLYRGLPLAVAHEQLAEHPQALTVQERAFLEASTTAHRSAHRRSRLRILVIAVVVTLALVAGLLAWQQNAANSQQELQVRARRIAGTAESLRQSDPRLAMQLSLAAWRLADLPDTRSALLAAAHQREQSVFTDPDAGPATLRRLSTDGQALTSIGADQVTRWDIGTRQRIASWPGLGPDAPRTAMPRSDALTVPVFSSQDLRPGPLSLRDLTTGRTTGPLWPQVNAGAEKGPGGWLLGYSITATAYVVHLWDGTDRRQKLELRFPRTTRGTGDPNTPLPEFADLERILREHRMTSAPGGGPDAELSPDGRRLMVCLPGQPPQVWDVPARRRVPTPWAPVTTSPCSLERIGFTPDSRALTFITGTGVDLWDLASGQRVTSISQTGLHEATISQDRTHLVATDGTQILLWRLDYPRHPIFRHSLTGQSATDLRVNPATGQIRYLGGPPGAERTVHTLSWGQPTGSRWEPLPILDAAFARHGTALVSIRPNANHQTVDLQLFTLPVSTSSTSSPRTTTLPPVPCTIGTTERNPYPQCILLTAFDSSGSTLAFGSSQQRTHLTLWDLRRQRATQVDTGITAGTAQALSFGPDNSLLLTSESPPPTTSDSLHLIDPHRRVTLKTVALTQVRAAVGTPQLALRPDGHLLVTGRSQVVELPSGRTRPPARQPGEAGVPAFSPNGRQLAIGDDSGRVALWDGDVNRRLGELISPDTGSDAVTALAFTPDARVLAVATAAGTVRLWDTSSHRPIGSPLPTPGDVPLALAFNADGTTLYVAGERVRLQRYRIDPSSAATAVCQRADGGLTPRQWRGLIGEAPYRNTCPPPRAP